MGIQERKWRKGGVLECMKREERKVEEEDLTIKKKSEIEHNLEFGEYCLRDTGHVVNVRLYCPTTDKLLKLVLTYT